MRTLGTIFRIILAIPLGAALALSTVYFIPYVTTNELAESVEPVEPGWPGRVWGMQVDEVDVGDYRYPPDWHRCKSYGEGGKSYEKCPLRYTIDWPGIDDFHEREVKATDDYLRERSEQASGSSAN